jgi:hypothetical protein
MSMLKELRSLLELATQQGWTVEQRNTNHYKLVAPNGKVVFTSSTPSDRRAIENIKRDLRSGGLVITRKNERRK